jgi:predicted RNA binding protein YcfA (HicA-like mRNA interferase family)
MPPLPVLSGKEILKAFEKLGWVYARRKASNMVMTRTGTPVNISIPDHKEVDAGTLRTILRISETGIETFLEALRK